MRLRFSDQYVYVYSPIKATLHARHTETDRNRQWDRQTDRQRIQTIWQA